jgi:DNA-binding NtrC family response regulator
MNMAKTVLLVDDDVDLMDSVAEVLRTRGYFLLEHSDPREALESCLPKEDVSGVLTEMDLPEIHRIHPTVEELLMTGNLRWWGPASSDDGDYVEESFSYAELFQANEDTLVS